MRDTVKIFRSYRDAAAALAASCPDDPDKGAVDAFHFLMAILDYGLDGEEANLSGAAAAMWLLTKPNLDASIKKAEAGAKGGSTPKAGDKQTPSKQEAPSKGTPSKTQPEEGSRKKEVGSRSKEDTPKAPKGADFDAFWLAYPKKVGKDAARKAFEKVKAPLETLLSAIEQQKCSRQWQEDGGQYIPNPSTWLNQGRWQDELPGRSETPQEEWSRKLDDDVAATIRQMFPNAKGGQP